MTLYEINASLDDLIERSIDPETGELNIDPAELEQLQLAREEKIENLALYIKNLGADAMAIREEEKALAERRKKAEAKADRLAKLLADALNGEKFQTAKVAISYRNNSSVELDPGFVEWAQTRGYDFMLRYKPPEADKASIAKELKKGLDTPFARIVQRTSMTIK